MSCSALLAGASRSPIQGGVSPGRSAGANGAGYGWGCCRIVVWLSVLPTANSGPPVRPDRLPPLQMNPPAVLKPAGNALAGGTAVHWVPFHCSVTEPFRLMAQTSLALKIGR